MVFLVFQQLVFAKTAVQGQWQCQTQTNSRILQALGCSSFDEENGILIFNPTAKGKSFCSEYLALLSAYSNGGLTKAALTRDDASFHVSVDDFLNVLELPTINEDIQLFEAHPMYLYFGLLSSLTDIFGRQRDGKDFLPFQALRTEGDFRYHFSAAVESNLLYWIIYFSFVDQSDSATHSKLVTVCDPTHNPLLAQCQTLVAESRSNWFCVENLLIIQTALAVFTCFFTTPVLAQYAVEEGTGGTAASASLIVLMSDDEDDADNDAGKGTASSSNEDDNAEEEDNDEAEDDDSDKISDDEVAKDTLSSPATRKGRSAPPAAEDEPPKKKGRIKQFSRKALKAQNTAAEKTKAAATKKKPVQKKK